MKNILLWQAWLTILIFLEILGWTKTWFFRKSHHRPFFCKGLSVTQNGHFFPKNVGKISPKMSENYVLLCENTFCKKWQSGRINFFWGGFSAFMVYALTLISTGAPLLARRCFIIHKTTPSEKCSHLPLVVKNLI